MIVRAEDVRADTRCSRRIGLGLPPRHGDAYPHLNAGSSSSIDPEVAERLREVYREPNQRLATLLGRDLDWDRA
jgi:hypothetical protein